MSQLITSKLRVEVSKLLHLELSCVQVTSHTNNFDVSTANL